MLQRPLIIATRQSPLALWQAEWVKSRLLTHYPSLTVELLGLTTTADQRLDITLSRIGGKGLFVKELEEALKDGRADIAVHSMKDVPMTLPEGLCLPVICMREESRDALVSNQYTLLDTLPPNAVIGTSSLRRQSQIRALRPDFVIKNLRGNINSRLQRLDRGEYDALILAAIGLKRLDFAHRITDYLTLEQSLPAAGQGALGIECRANDHAILSLISVLNHADTFAAVSAERALCRALNGGCLVPIAAYAEVHNEVINLRGLVANRDGSHLLRTLQIGPRQDAEKIGQAAALQLIEQGATRLLQEFFDEGGS